jgi:hypothetical protein
MLLADNAGSRLYRKVPFGMAPEPEVLSGFAGSLTDRQQEKTHPTLLPATRKIGLRLTAEDTALRAELYKGEKRISPAGVREWDGILVRGGNDYRIRIFSTRPDILRPDGSGYDVRILSY